MEPIKNQSQLPAQSEREETSLLQKVGARATAFLRGQVGKEAIPGLLLFFVGWIVSGTPFLFSAYPFGIALLCGTRGHMLGTLLGLAVGAVSWGSGGVVWGGLYIVAFLLRLLFSSPGVQIKAIPRTIGQFQELPQLQVTTAILTGLAAGVYEWVVSGFTLDTALFGVGMVVGCGVFTLCFSGLFSYQLTREEILGKRGIKPARRSRGERLMMEIGLVALLGVCIKGIARLDLFGLNPAYLLATGVTLFVARRFGALRGCCLGLLSVLWTEPLYAPAFGLLGLVTGGLWHLGMVYAITLGCVGGICWASFTGGLSGFLGVAPEMATASVLLLPLLPRLYSDAIAKEVKQDRQGAEDAIRGVLSKETSHEALENLSHAFRTLSGAFSDTTLAPDRQDAKRMCEEVFLRCCVGCPERGHCQRGESREWSTAVGHLADCVVMGHPVVSEGLPTSLVTECKHLDTILEGIRGGGGALWQERHERGNKDFPSVDYALVAEVLSDLQKREEREGRPDTSLARTMRGVLADRGFRPSSVFVRGARHKRILVGCGEFGVKQKEAVSSLVALEEAAGCRLSSPVFDATGEVMTMETHTRERYALEVAFVRRPAKGGTVSGDIVSRFDAPLGYTYLLLSDGMGTGEGAARISTTCAVVLEKLLGGGVGEEVALGLLNRLLTVRDGEMSGTVDLLQFDAYYGGASFFKSGATSSYVRRDGNLFRLRSKTLPLGVVKETDTERLRFDTKVGDVIIMLSDGVSQTSEDAPWLMELLSKPLGQNLTAACEKILEETAKHTASRDDMTAVIARVTEAG